ncbi:MAG: GH3 auxin-responsive promoter family protein [Actinomycetota bacterium]|nr:GH3 auxin-responsive promoter family protein [Actinomycetota bacterium]
MTMLVGALSRAYMAAAAPAARVLGGALDNPGRAQASVLRRIVTSNRDCAFGRAHGFSSILNYTDFAKCVPIVDYEDLRPWVDRIRAGEVGVLTGERVSFLEPTGASSGASKLIPYTRSLKREIARAVHPWIRDLLSGHPELLDGRSYWAISPPLRLGEQERSAVPIGASHDLEYLPRAVGALLDKSFVVPRAACEIDDLDAGRYVTLRALLGAEDLAFISVWNPSFLTLLVGRLDDWFERLVHDVERGAISIALEPSLRERLERRLPARPDVAARLRRFGSRPPDDLGELWSRLAVISCWTDGHARRAVDALRLRFPDVEIQGKGLIATEGVVSIPLARHPAPPAAVTSHFLEFVPEGGGDALPVDQIEEGYTYEVVITTGGGLYRYRLKDMVRVQGRVGRTPSLRFVGRVDATSDLCGEKLTPAFVERALSAGSDTSGVRPAFALLSPRWGNPPSYDLWVELQPEDARLPERAERLADAIEAELRRAHHYDLCRALGQLGPLRARPINHGERAYERVCTQRGQRAGAVKPPALIADLEWSDVFEEVVT